MSIGGRVKFFNTNRGYGFIAPDGGGSDVFVHVHDIEAAGMKILVAGQLVAYEVGLAREAAQRPSIFAYEHRRSRHWSRAFPSAAGTAPHECADRQRAAALASPQREKLGVDDVVGAGVSAGAEPGREANPRRRLRRGKRKQRSGNGKSGESPSHLALLRL
jgi:cold shock protein